MERQPAERDHDGQSDNGSKEDHDPPPFSRRDVASAKPVFFDQSAIIRIFSTKSR